MEQKLKLAIIALRLALLSAIILGADQIVLEVVEIILKVAQTARFLSGAVGRVRNILGG